MAVATISVNFASEAQGRAGDSSVTSISPLRLRTTLTSGNSLGYDLNLRGATFQSTVTLVGLTNISNTQEVAGELASLYVAGGTIVKKQLKVDGASTLAGVTASGLITANNGLTVNNVALDVNNGATFNSLNIDPGGTLQIGAGGSLAAPTITASTGITTNSLTVNTNQLLANAGISSVGTTEVNGSFTVSNGNASNLTGNVTVGGNLVATAGTATFNQPGVGNFNIGDNAKGRRYVSTGGPGGSGSDGDIWLQYQ